MAARLHCLPPAEYLYYFCVICAAVSVAAICAAIGPHFSINNLLLFFRQFIYRLSKSRYRISNSQNHFFSALPAPDNNNFSQNPLFINQNVGPKNDDDTAVKPQPRPWVSSGPIPLLAKPHVNGGVLIGRLYLQKRCRHPPFQPPEGINPSSTSFYL